MTEKLKACREAFEKWHKSQYSGRLDSDERGWAWEGFMAAYTRPTAPKCCDAVGKEYCWRNDCAAEDCKVGESVTDDALREAIERIRTQFCLLPTRLQSQAQQDIALITRAIKGESK